MLTPEQRQEIRKRGKRDTAIRNAIQSLIRAGALMSNVCFNVSQTDSKYATYFRNSYKEWDAALSVYRELLKGAK